jgi:hypothetical protein
MMTKQRVYFGDIWHLFYPDIPGGSRVYNYFLDANFLQGSKQRRFFFTCDIGVSIVCILAK